MVDVRACLNTTIARLKALRELKKKIDPASGMSVLIRRGVLSDRVEDEDGRERREYIEIETCYHMEEIIDLLIKGQMQSLNLWTTSSRKEIKLLEEALEAAKQV